MTVLMCGHYKCITMCPWPGQNKGFGLCSPGPPTWVLSLLPFASGKDRWKRFSTDRNSLPTEHMACVTFTKPPVHKTYLLYQCVGTLIVHFLEWVHSKSVQSGFYYHSLVLFFSLYWILKTSVGNILANYEYWAYPQKCSVQSICRTNFSPIFYLSIYLSQRLYSW